MGVTLADVFRQHAAEYIERYGSRMLPSHHQAIRAISNCRTERMGGHVYHCPDGGETIYHYHSCRNRHCPKCQPGATHKWLEGQQDLRLPVPYFMLTFTLPEGLRRLARRHQRLIYKLLFQTSAAATKKLAKDPRLLGGKIGMLGSCIPGDGHWSITRMSITWYLQVASLRMASGCQCGRITSCPPKPWPEFFAPSSGID